MAYKNREIKYVVGIDEVGRGPLAGPITIGAVLVKNDNGIVLGKNFFRGARDSKQLTPLGRAIWFEKIKEARRLEVLQYKVSFVGSALVDRHGLARATRLAIRRTLQKFGIEPGRILVLLDGGLKAPEEFQNQKTIIRGDEREPIIGLASIMAKVLRDRKMERFALEYPQFDFHLHKGYGTKRHISLIKKFGPCEIHRRSFLTKFLVKPR